MNTVVYLSLPFMFYAGKFADMQFDGLVCFCIVCRMRHSAYYRLVGQDFLLSGGLIHKEFCSEGAADSQVY